MNIIYASNLDIKTMFNSPMIIVIRYLKKIGFNKIRNQKIYGNNIKMMLISIKFIGFKV